MLLGVPVAQRVVALCRNIAVIVDLKHRVAAIIAVEAFDNIARTSGSEDGGGVAAVLGYEDADAISRGGTYRSCRWIQAGTARKHPAPCRRQPGF